MNSGSNNPSNNSPQNNPYTIPSKSSINEEQGGEKAPNNTLEPVLEFTNFQGNPSYGHVDEFTPRGTNNNMDDRLPILLNVNLFKMAVNRPTNNPGLSRVSFCPFDNSVFVCGTEEQDTFKKGNCLIVGTLEIDSKQPRSTTNNSLNLSFSHPVPDYIRDVLWFDEQHILFAANQKMGVLRVSPEKNAGVKFLEIVMFPEFHKDAIREVAVSDGNKNLVISGGFDGNVFVTDITKLISDIRKNEKKSENSLYPCREVVGSVSWHITDPYLASCTTDTGTLHIFDIRTDKRRPAIVHDTTKKELYCHSYRDSNNIMLGFGDGTIQIFDLRSKRCTLSMNDPHQNQIGEIRFDHKNNCFATYGSPSVSVFKAQETMTIPCGHASLNSSPSTPYYKTSGDLRRGTNQVVLTDSFGNFSVFDYANFIQQSNVMMTTTTSTPNSEGNTGNTSQ